jgi:hypothetical protein
MDLARLVINETSPEQVIMLKEREGHRSFSIVIGIAEAMAINRAINERRAPRPLTHDLLNSVLQHLNTDLERVIINDLRDKTFYAKLVLTRDGESIEVDARPSDAIALATLRDTPLFVEEKVLKQVCKDGDLD